MFNRGRDLTDQARCKGKVGMWKNPAGFAAKRAGRGLAPERKGGYRPAQKPRKGKRGGREQPQRKKGEKWDVTGSRERKLVSPK